MNKILKIWILSVLACGFVQAAFVTIGDAGNMADPLAGYGAVAYEYKISDHEVTIAEFQQATGAGDGDENYWNSGSHSVGTGAPATWVSLFEAMRYCNWLTSGDVNAGAYSFGFNNDGDEYFLVDRALAIFTYETIYAVPTEDEWHKAAYYTGNPSDYWSLYANGTDVAPTTAEARYNDHIGSVWIVETGAEEQNGTYDMMGNVFEWMENPLGVLGGGSYESPEIYLRSSQRGSEIASGQHDSIGFRPVEIVPEPSTVLLFGIGGVGAWLLRRNRMKAQKEDD